MMQTIAKEQFITNQSNEGDGHPPEISIFLPPLMKNQTSARCMKS
jgi:hypothetical protein